MTAKLREIRKGAGGTGSLRNPWGTPVARLQRSQWVSVLECTSDCISLPNVPITGCVNVAITAQVFCCSGAPLPNMEKNIYAVLAIYRPVTILQSLYLMHLISQQPYEGVTSITIKPILQVRETEAQSSEVTCQRSHS